MADRAERLLRAAQRGELSLRGHQIVVAETVWVLQSFYDHSRTAISGALIPLLTGHGLKVEGLSVVVQALESIANSNVDFADALLAETARSRGEGISSFDEDFRRPNITWRKPD